MQIWNSVFCSGSIPAFAWNTSDSLNSDFALELFNWDRVLQPRGPRSTGLVAYSGKEQLPGLSDETQREPALKRKDAKDTNPSKCNTGNPLPQYQGKSFNWQHLWMPSFNILGMSVILAIIRRTASLR